MNDDQHSGTDPEDAKMNDDQHSGTDPEDAKMNDDQHSGTDPEETPKTTPKTGTDPEDELVQEQQVVETALKARFKGLKNEAFTFRVYTSREFLKKVSNDSHVLADSTGVVTE